MKIRLAIIDNDKNYTDRIRFALNTKYENEIELYVFSSIESVKQSLSNMKIDVVLVDSDMDIASIESNKYICAYLCSQNDINTINGRKAISKFQRVDIFYNDVLNLYAEKISNSNVDLSISNGKNDIVVFISASGGVGTSTVAAAYALREANNGKSPLYINLEMFGDSKRFFNAEGNQSMSDIIYAIKNKKTNVILKLKSSIKKDGAGVSFIDSCSIPLDLADASDEDYASLIDNLNSMDYSKIIIDTDFSFNKKTMVLLKKAYKVVLVNDGSDISNAKTEKMLLALNCLDDQAYTGIVDKLYVFYNKFSTKTSSKMDSIRSIGGSRVYAGFPQNEIIKSLAEITDFDNI